MSAPALRVLSGSRSVVPIFAIGVSHGVQKISAVGDAALEGANSEEAARRTFRQLFIPAIVALLADLVGFVTILAIPVQVIREMAITASLGIGVVILTDLILLHLAIRDRARPHTRWAFGVMLLVFLAAHALWFTWAQAEGWVQVARWFRAVPLT